VKSLVVVVLALVASLLVYVVMIVGVAMHTEAICLQEGFRNVKVTWKFDRYCTTRLMGTDVVLPLSRILEDSKQAEVEPMLPIPRRGLLYY